MGIPAEIPLEKVEKASKWTVFFLIDLRIVFIITFVYVSVVNLISTTASSETKADVQSMNNFTLTSKPQHFNVPVRNVDDAVLWKCRVHSDTRDYYVHLYLGLIFLFILALSSFTVAKLAIICGAKHGLTCLWQIAVVQYLQKLDEIPPDEETKNCLNLLSEDHEININNAVNYCRMVPLSFNAIILPLSIFFGFLSYDLHPVSCIFGPGEDNIAYNDDETKYTVEIRFSSHVLLFQIIVFSILLIVFIVFMPMNIYLFYYSSKKVVNLMKEKIKEKLEKQKQT